jgi:hypothetical protein
MRLGTIENGKVWEVEGGARCGVVKWNRSLGMFRLLGNHASPLFNASASRAAFRKCIQHVKLMSSVPPDIKAIPKWHEVANRITCDENIAQIAVRILRKYLSS